MQKWVIMVLQNENMRPCKCRCLHGPSPIFGVTSRPKLEKELAEGVYIWTQPWHSTITLFQFSSWVSTSGPSPAARKARVLKGKVCSTGLLDQLVYMAAYKYLVIL